MAALQRLLGLEAGDLPPVMRLGAVYAAIGAATAVADALVQATFLARAGADALPWVLLARALLSPPLAWLYSRLARRGRSRWVMMGLATLAGCVVLFAHFAITLGSTGAIAAYAAHEIATALLTMHWGVYLLDHLDRDVARRGVAPIYAASRAAAAVGGIAVGLLVPSLGAADGLYVAAGLFFIAAPMAFIPHRASPITIPLAIDPTDADEAVPAPKVRKRGWALLRTSPLLLAICVATVAMVLVRVMLRYGQQSILDALDEVALASLLGWYAAGANMVSIALQLLVTGRLLERIGAGMTNLLYAGATLVTQIGLWIFGGTGSVSVALAARFADGELKHALKTPVSPLFYRGFYGADRIRARAFVLGMVSPSAQLAGALALGVLVSAPHLMGPLGVAMAAIYVLASLAQARAFDRAVELPGRFSKKPPEDN